LAIRSQETPWTRKAGPIIFRALRTGAGQRRRSRRRFLGEAKLSKFLLKLYVAGATPRAVAAIENLRRICEKDLKGRYELEVIDVLKNPELAEQDKILATPTLIKQLPPPLRRVIGDLSDAEKVLLGLELRQVLSAPDSGKGPR
jgi:circadian clock protein KaiB